VVDAVPAELAPVPPAPVPPRAVEAILAQPSHVHAVDLGAYADVLHARLLVVLRYPKRAQRLALQGTTRVRIHVAVDGSLVATPQVEESSGFGLLDDEALRMVERAAPFAPLPTGFAKSVASLVVPIEFVI
jgi:protein TonB